MKKYTLYLPLISHHPLENYLVHFHFVTKIFEEFHLQDLINKEIAKINFVI